MIFKVVALVLLAAGCSTASVDREPTTPSPHRAQERVLAGRIIAPGMLQEFRMALNETSEGAWAGTAHFFTQPDRDFPMANLHVTDARLSFEILLEGAPPQRFAVDFDANRNGSGTFSVLDQQLPLFIGPIPSRPQTPRPPLPYEERTITYDNAPDSVRITGILAIPPGDGPHPAIVLLSGSGAQSRDCILFFHEWMRVLADHLARRGIASFRADDRGVGGSTGALSHSTIEDLAEDALLAIDAIAELPEIDGDRIGLLGHSQGASVAALAASQSERVKFVVHAAGVGTNGVQTLIDQEVTVLRLAGTSEEDIASLIDVKRRALTLAIAEEMDEEQFSAALEALVRLQLSLNGLEYDPAAVEMGRAQMTAPVMRSLIAWRSAPVFERISAPILAINGSLDTQVPAESELGAIEAMNLENVTIRAFDRLNHLFQPAERGTVDEYDEIETTISPIMLEYVTTWIQEHS